jgi:hypothetical protein
MNYSSDIEFSYPTIYVRVGLEVESVTQEFGQTVAKINYVVQAKNRGFTDEGIAAQCLKLKGEAVVGSSSSTDQSSWFPLRNKPVDAQSSYDENKLDEGWFTFYLPRSETGAQTAQINAYLYIDGHEETPIMGLVSVSVPKKGVVYAKHEGTWKSVTAVFAKVNGEWVAVSDVSAKVNGTWK